MEICYVWHAAVSWGLFSVLDLVVDKHVLLDLEGKFDIKLYA